MMCVKSHIFFYIFLTFHLHAMAMAELDPAYRVNAMNHILGFPGWRDVLQPTGFGTTVPWKEMEENRVLQVQYLLEPDRSGKIVNNDNAVHKVREAYRLLSCRYGHALEVFCEYGLRAAGQCGKINDPLGLSNCVEIFLQMFEDVAEELMPRLQGLFACVQRLSSATPFDAAVPETVDAFKNYIDRLTFNTASLDREYHKAIIASASNTMTDGLQRLREFYANSCNPATQEDQSNGIAIIESNIQKVEGERSPFQIASKIKKRVHKVAKWYVSNYDRVSFGFKYDPVEKKTRIRYNPS